MGALDFIIRTGTRFFDAILPHQCPVCGDAISSGDIPVCAACLALMPGSGAEPGMRLRPFLDNSRYTPGIAEAWFSYSSDSPYSALIKDAKYHCRPSLSFELGAVFARHLIAKARNGAAHDIRDIDLLLPAPMHWRRRMARGYNQAQEIAEGMASVTGAAVGDNLVARHPHNPQARSSRSERLDNLQGTMEIRHPEELAGLHIAIVDDVVTTGSTLSECILTLSRADVRAASLGILALAATQQ